VKSIQSFEDEKVISHITRVNYVGTGSKMIVPKEVIKELGLKWDGDYVEFFKTTIRGRKVVMMAKTDG
jgi:hypothetical protein